MRSTAAIGIWINTRRPRPALIPDKVCHAKNVNRCAYQNRRKQKELHFSSAAIWVTHNLSTKKRNVSESVKESLKLPNNGGHRVIPKIVMDETYMPFYDVPTRKESKVCVFEEDLMSTMVKKQQAMRKVMYAVFFRSTGLIKAMKLEGQKTVTANWYTTKCLPEILQEILMLGD
ncbi:uncharacterized protein TNCV_1849341 [Trichonephila clavipes]|nr:uncharacterized protein TNCV_1849341 [Trichonephila clavipes]